jgi:MFS family permease
MELIRTHKALFATLFITMLYALHYGLPLYVTSTFLKFSGFTIAAVSLLYGLASLLSLVFSNHIAKYIKLYHSYGFTFTVVLAEIVTTIAMVITKNPILIAIFFLAHFVFNAIIFVLLNIFIEVLTPPHHTGSVRGIFLTLLNAGIMVSPIMGGLILHGGDGNNYTALYFAASALLLPCFYLLHRYLREMRDSTYESHDLFQSFAKVMRHKNLQAPVLAQCALHSFYAVMVIYAPLYITKMLDISLVTYLTVIVPITLIPLVLLPYELGFLADAKYDEKEFMIVGLSILGVTSFILGAFVITSILLALLILFIARIGAALVETMSYTYYYKKIARNDPAMASLFSNINTTAGFFVPTFLFLISPLLFFHEGLIFILLGVGIFSALYSLIQMKTERQHNL